MVATSAQQTDPDLLIGGQGYRIRYKDDVRSRCFRPLKECPDVAMQPAIGQDNNGVPRLHTQ